MGGSKPTPPQVIAAPPAPDVGKTAEDAYAAQAKYNPLLTQQSVELQKQYAPQLAQSQLDIASQFTPQYRQLLEQNYPQLSTLSNQVSQQLTNPYSLSGPQQQAQDAIRGRARTDLSRSMRERANLGGTLFGGRSARQEGQALAGLEQGFASEDINRSMQNRQQSLQELVTLLQLSNPQVQQPNAPNYTQGVVPGGDNLYNAMVQNQGNFGIIPGQAGTPGLAGPLAQAGGTIAAKAFFACLAGEQAIATPTGPVPIAELRAGDRIDGGRVLMKYEYVASPTDFTTLVFDDGAVVETCHQHLIAGHPAVQYRVGDRIQGRVIVERRTSTRTVPTYDLLTDGPEAGYAVQGIWIPSMIPHLHRLARVLEEVAA